MSVWLGVGMDVCPAIDVGAGPGAVIDQDGMGAPAEAGSEPAEAAERWTNSYGWPEVNGASDVEAGTRWSEDDDGTIYGDVVEVGIVGLDLNVAAGVDYIDVGVGGEVAVVAGLAAETLNGVHDFLLLVQEGVAELAGPGWVAGHHVEDGGKGEKREDAGSQGRLSAVTAVLSSSP